MSESKFWKRTQVSQCESSNEIDDIDRIPDNAQVGIWDFLKLIVSIILHCVDVGYDIYIIYHYFQTNQLVYFAWTVVFTTVPTIIITSISISMYIQDVRRDIMKCNKALLRIVLCIFGSIVQLAIVIRLVDSLKYALKSKKQIGEHRRKYYTKMAEEDTDIAMLKVFECYLESAFQIILQLALLLIDYSSGLYNNIVYQSIMIFLSFVTMGICMTSYSKSIRFDREDKRNITYLGLIVHFLWQLNFTVSRIFTITIGAILYPLWTIIAVVIHWFGMTVWLAGTRKTNFCGKNLFSEILFSSAVALVYIFNFISLQDGPTRKSYITFYTICAIEIIFASIIWGIKASTFIKNWTFYLFLTLPIATFAISVFFLLIYYMILHPNKLGFKYTKNKKIFSSLTLHSNIYEAEVS